MTQQEFESRVKMQVSCEEYNVIEQVYMNSDVDKDEFCRLWAKMNTKRIAKAKAAQAQLEAQQALNGKVWDIYYKYIQKDYQWKTKTLVHTALNKTQEKVLQQAGFELKFNTYFYKNMADMLWEIELYLKKQ